MRKRELLLLVSGCFFLPGCGLYVVKKSGPQGDHTGIPFYVKTSGCRRDIVRLEPYYVLTFNVKSSDKTTSSESTTLSKTQFESEATRNLRDAVAGKVTGGRPVPLLWQDVKKMSYDPYLEETKIKPDDWFVITDTIASYTYVDYATPYTLNVRKPLIGSASATTKLNADGTLSEGTAQADDKTLSTLISAVPTSELIKGAAGISKLAFDGGTGIALELKIEPKAVKITHTYRSPSDHSPCARTTPAGTDPGGNYDLLVEDATEDKKPAADDNTIKVNGTVQLPKNKDTSDAKK